MEKWGWRRKTHRGQTARAQWLTGSGFEGKGLGKDDPRFSPGSGEWVNSDATKQGRETEIRASFNNFVFVQGCVYVYKYEELEEKIWEHHH